MDDQMPPPSTKRITPEHIAGIMGRARFTVTKLGEKTCCVHARLANGYEITEVAACVDPANYNEEIGKEIAMHRIADKVWQLEGWYLAVAEDGRP